MFAIPVLVEDRGDRNEDRFDRRADSARDDGHERVGDRLERRGGHADQRLDRKGDRINHRQDRKGNRVTRTNR